MNTKTSVANAKQGSNRRIVQQGTSDSTEQGQAVEQGQKRRGAPKGARGPRRLVFIAFAVTDTGVLKEEIIFDKPEEATEQNALSRFETSHPGLDAVVSGPYREVRATPAGTIRRRESLSIPLSELRLTANRVSGEYNGWKVIGHYIDGHSDKLFLMFDSPVDPNSKKRVPSKGNIVDAASLQNMKQL